MRKFTAVLSLIILLISVTSCGRFKPKKIIPADKAKEEQPETITVIPTPSQETNQDQEEETNKPNETINGENSSTQPYDQSQVPDTEISINIPSGISNQKFTSWQPGTNKLHNVPVLNSKYKTILDQYEGYFTGDTESKVIYLTFDEGYEGGYTSRILDTLKSNDVKAAFFVVKSYIKRNPDLVKRMVNEGHIVGNHSTHHPCMPDVVTEKGVDGVVKELSETADYFKEVTGHDMPKFYRPPEGAWSEATLYITNSLGYKTILWSMAHKDWDVNNQPPSGAAYKFVDTYYHNGAILLLHPQSKTNTEDLDSIIKHLKEIGYRFAPLTELHK